MWEAAFAHRKKQFSFLFRVGTVYFQLGVNVKLCTSRLGLVFGKMLFGITTKNRSVCGLVRYKIDTAIVLKIFFDDIDNRVQHLKAYGC